MEFSPAILVVCIDQLESVRTITIHVTIAVRCSTVAEQEHHLVRRLWSQTNKVPEHVRVLETRDKTYQENMNQGRCLKGV